MSAESKKSELFLLSLGDVIKIGKTVFVIQSSENITKSEEVKKEIPKTQVQKSKEMVTPGCPEEEKNAKKSDTTNCKICFTSEANGVFIPCGHNFTCYNCANKCSDCPMCRREVYEVIKIYKA